MLTLPKPPRFHLSDPPLVQALAQLNYPLVARLSSLSGLAPIQDALQDAYPYMQQQQVQEINLNFGPAGPGQAESSFSTITTLTDDDGWQVAIGAGSTTLSVGNAYSGQREFSERFLRLCEVLAASAGIRRADRLGVRYLDVVSIDPSGRDGWSTWFRPELVGLTQPDLLGGTDLVASITETRLTRPASTPGQGWAGSAVQSVLRHGVVPPNSVLAGVPPQPIATPSFIFDFDIFVVGAQIFLPEIIQGRYEALHGEIEKIFYWSLTDEGAKRFGMTVEMDEAAQG